MPLNSASPIRFKNLDQQSGVPHQFTITGAKQHIEFPSSDSFTVVWDMLSHGDGTVRMSKTSIVRGLLSLFLLA